MKFINPNYALQEKNIFTIRRDEYETLEVKLRQILIPAEELGFNIVDFGIKDSRFSSGELSKTIKQKIIIKLRKGTSDIDLSMDIPKLIDNNYIIINGRKKIPQFQLFDIPVVTRGKNIKLRTNVITIVIESSREEPYINISFLGKKVPLSLLMFAYFGIEAVDKKFGLSQIKVRTEPITSAEKLMEDLLMFYEESSGYTQDDFIKEVGRNYSQYNSRSKGEDVIYALDLAMKADPISTEFFRTESVLDEVVNAIFNKGTYDDLNYSNKRIRCFEYIILSKVSKAIFDLCISNRTTRQPKFNINSTRILSECNVSDIIQYDFSINPIEELTKLSRTSLIGPGGFARENVPEHLRDITQSMFGRICPVDTPDRENCGILQNLVPNARLDENLKFSDEISNNPISVPVSMIPFLEHDDQTRLQMASSQMRQSILTKGFDTPMVQSGCEWLYSAETQFLKTAKKDGEVVYVDDMWIIIKYDDTETDVINIDCRKISVGNMDFMKILVAVGDRVSKGDIVAESMFMNDGKINFGRNLLVAINPYFGYNYEDGIVISDRLVDQDIFTSMHYLDLSFTIPPHKVLTNLNENGGEFKPLPDLNERIGIGKPYAKMKEISTGLDYYSIFNHESELYTNKQIVISDRRIFPNIWNKEIPVYNTWIEKEIEEEKIKQRAFHKILRSVLDKKELAMFIREQSLNLAAYVGKYKIKGEMINGVHVKMFGLFQRKINPGDKIANRHGNKGVISKIIPHEKMYKLKDGRNVDIVINPLGIISRINLGQLYECHLTMALDSVKTKMKKMISEGKTKNEIITYVMGFIHTIDRTENLWYSNNMEAFLQKETTNIDNSFVDGFYIIQPPFESSTMEMVEQAMEYTETPFRQKVYDPISDTEIENPINVGFIYFYKMVHIAEARLAARGIGSYSKKTMQPLGGRRNKGGQRCGEMETSCFIGHAAIENLDECMTTKSDCVDRKNAYLKQVIDAKPINVSNVPNSKAETVKLLESMLTVVGLDPETH